MNIVYNVMITIDTTSTGADSKNFKQNIFNLGIAFSCFGTFSAFWSMYSFSLISKYMNLLTTTQYIRAIEHTLLTWSKKRAKKNVVKIKPGLP